MTPVFIGWLITVILWAVFAILSYEARKYNEFEIAQFANIMELVCLGFMWIFIGFSHGWW